MALSAFDNRDRKPKDSKLRQTLGRSFVLWEALRSHIQSDYAPATEDWNFSGAQWGWALRLKQKKRTVLYMTPCRKHFLVGFALGEKAVTAARKSSLPSSVIKTIDEAPRYAEGRGVRLQVRFKKDLESIEILAALKMQNNSSMI